MRGWPARSSARQRHSSCETLGHMEQKRERERASHSGARGPIALSRRDRVSHSGVEDRPQLTMLCQSSATQLKKQQILSAEHVKVTSSVRKRTQGQEPHRVLEVVPQNNDHTSGVEGLSGPCRGKVPKTRQSSGSVQHDVVNYRPWSTRASTVNRRSRSSAVPGRPRSGKLP